jgi:NADH:ubiquinone oxidoreductase subunit F (NADH-binding)
MERMLIGTGDSSVHASIDGYLRAGGYRAWMRVNERSCEQIIDVVERSQLTGKGGAGYPTHAKMRLMLAQPGKTKYLVINGSEHEPGSAKDRYLIEHHPHKVLEGALIMAHSVGASDVVIAINESWQRSSRSFGVALEEALAHDAIDFSGIDVTARTIPDDYIVGEETALLEVLDGRPALPRKKPPFPIERGLRGLPTLVQNVETATHLPYIMSVGAESYRALGINGKAVTLCTLGAEFTRPGVHEVPLGTPIYEVLFNLGGGLRNGERIKAIQPGGPSSGFLAPSSFDLPLDAASLRAHGSALGCAAIKAYSITDCMVRAIGGIMDFFAQGSCGQCPHCRMETNMLNAIVKKVLAGTSTWKLLDQVHGLVKLAMGQGICTLISMPVAPITTGLTLFRSEFDAHIDRACPICLSNQDAVTIGRQH